MIPQYVRDIPPFRPDGVRILVLLFLIAVTAKAIVAIALLLSIGDAASTFIYHVPEHAIGRLHCRVHHESKQSFQHYAVLSSRPLVMLDGFLGAVPYFVVAIALYPFSPIGTILGLLFGEFHVVWRHTTKMGWQTPAWALQICHALRMVTPEEHWAHHENGAIAFGDIFTFYDKPAQQWLQILIQLKKTARKYFLQKRWG
ncbi:MAG: sterol desaturase [Phormidesmis sp.]